MKLGKSPVEDNPVKCGKSPVVEKAPLRKIRTAFAEYVHVRSEFIWETPKQKEFVGQGTCTGKNVFTYGYLFIRSPDLSKRVVKNVTVKILTAYNNICFIRSAVVKETSSLLTVALALKRFYCHNFVNDLKHFRLSRGLKPFLSIV